MGIGSHTKPHRGRSDDWCTPPSILEALLVEAEHARAVRIVKAVVKHAAHMEQKTKLNREANAYWQGKLDGAENILAALQRGRGGKG